MIIDPLFQRFLEVRTEEQMALGQPLLDAGVMPLCIMAPGKGCNWFISSVYPASAGLFNGIVLNATGDSPEACVAAILAKLDEQWEGL